MAAIGGVGASFSVHACILGGAGAAERPRAYHAGMRRPFPVHPRGPRRRRPAIKTLLLACPRVCPEWELSTVAALMKPKPILRSAVAHRTGEQSWPVDGAERARVVLLALEREMGQRLPVHLQPAGEYHLVGELGATSREAVDQARAVAVALSRTAPGCWFVLGRLFVREGRFYRRRFGYRLELVAASDVHLSRPMRQLIRMLETVCETDWT